MERELRALCCWIHEEGVVWCIPGCCEDSRGHWQGVERGNQAGQAHNCLPQKMHLTELMKSFTASANLLSSQWLQCTTELRKQRETAISLPQAQVLYQEWALLCIHHSLWWGFFFTFGVSSQQVNAFLAGGGSALFSCSTFLTQTSWSTALPPLCSLCCSNLSTFVISQLIELNICVTTIAWKMKPNPCCKSIVIKCSHVCIWSLWSIPRHMLLHCPGWILLQTTPVPWSQHHDVLVKIW